VTSSITVVDLINLNTYFTNFKQDIAVVFLMKAKTQ